MVMRPPNLTKMTLDCPECGGDAKYVKSSIFAKLIGKRTVGTRFKCTKCKTEFSVMF